MQSGDESSPSIFSMTNFVKKKNKQLVACFPNLVKSIKLQIHKSSVNHKQKNCNESHTYACYSQTDKTNSEKHLKASREIIHYTQDGSYMNFFKRMHNI